MMERINHKEQLEVFASFLNMYKPVANDRLTTDDIG